jgi:hypothetical protein
MKNILIIYKLSNKSTMDIFPEVIQVVILGHLEIDEIIRLVGLSSGNPEKIIHYKIPHYVDFGKFLLKYRHFKYMYSLELDMNYSYRHQRNIFNKLGIKFTKLIQAIGGLVKYYEIPVLDDEFSYKRNVKWHYRTIETIDIIDKEKITSPLMRGKDINGRNFVCFRYKIIYNNNLTSDSKIEILHESHDNDRMSNWVSNSNSSLIFGGKTVVNDDPNFLDKINYLVNGGKNVFANAKIKDVVLV